MTRNTKVGIAIAGAVAAIGALGAAGGIAANKILSPQEESKAVIDDAASQLGVTPTQLSNALKKALENRVDAAVAAGLLTKEQAAEMKARIEANEPFFGHPGRDGDFRGRGFGHRGPFAGGAVFSAAAAYLGLSEADLREQLRTSTLADIAKKKGKSVTGLVTAMTKAAETEIDKAVAAGKLTTEQANAIKADLKSHVERLVNGERRDDFGVHPRLGRHWSGARGPPVFAGPFS